MAGQRKRVPATPDRIFCAPGHNPSRYLVYDETRRKTPTQPRLNAQKLAPKACEAMLGLETCARNCGLELSLMEPVKMRASQINGCAFCLDMHSKNARRAGETEQRLYLLNAWRESPLYTPRERAALGWTEALTLVAEAHAPDDVYDEVRKHFTEAETVNLTMAIVIINSWNRIAIATRVVHPVDKTLSGVKQPNIG